SEQCEVPGPAAGANSRRDWNAASAHATPCELIEVRRAGGLQLRQPARRLRQTAQAVGDVHHDLGVVFDVQFAREAAGVHCWAAARDEVLADSRLWASGGEVPSEKQPLDAGFHELPERLLDELRRDGSASELARLKASADRFARTVDSVVVLGIGGSYMAARA